MAAQAHADALGMWNSIGEDGRREWENDGRIDLRSVTNAVKQLPYHVARQRGHRCTRCHGQESGTGTDFPAVG